jgi:hypothetical protein
MLYRSFHLFATAIALAVAVTDNTIVLGQDNLTVPARLAAHPPTNQVIGNSSSLIGA